jgi:hypothetical protein
MEGEMVMMIIMMMMISAAIRGTGNGRVAAGLK